ncbi:trypsin-like peptidase domain-containing protein [Sporosarcina thermotolerans]|uniref:Trypsin-like peptidase domain-containing protein n=1 Tax=Sporosarcina thermotolerans TaxID=633404 RepID=A0AAW9A792_9BACL|nr:trypsin-like peptidase domain-containing protein [Sporosarcina thermotolerans]MDW0116498.1 trypsin-like peptidase domain-containing protein [Sporosarcina thermotolerans]WHT48727.1 trypsin-like peptidase domain-containing protein [Sporosarcina thermotolerans]
MDEFNQGPRNEEEKPIIHEPEEREEPLRYTNRSPKPKQRGGFLPALFGAILGGLLVWFLMNTTTGNDKGTPLVEREQSGVDNLTSERVSVDINTDVTDIVGQMADTVVGITNLQTVRNFWSSTETRRETGSGSGVIYKKEGGKAYIVTNHHVVENAEGLEITFDNGTKVEGRLIGSDMWTDLAVVEIDGSQVNTVIQFGDSDALKRGETVIAIGNPLGLGFAGSVTMGIVSGKDRSIPIDFDKNGTVDWQADVLQTDAAINPGNSGGALINLAGQLVGINSMKITQETVEGIGLAIPINIAVPIIKDLEMTGTVNRPTMGVSLMNLRDVPSSQQEQVLKLPKDVTDGVIVTQVLRNTPAEVAGVKQYDVIVEMDGKKIDDMVGLRKHLYNDKEVGDLMKMKVYRAGNLIEIEMELKDGNTF